MTKQIEKIERYPMKGESVIEWQTNHNPSGYYSAESIEEKLDLLASKLNEVIERLNSNEK